MLDIIDELRTRIPEEVRAARRAAQDKDKLLSQAQAEAARIVSGAQEEAMKLIDQQSVIREAQERADSLLKEAQEQARILRDTAHDDVERVLALAQSRDETIRTETDEYVKETLERLGEFLNREHSLVENGLKVFESINHE
ncbi:hypothetical protein [Metallibacterium sp.]